MWNRNINVRTPERDFAEVVVRSRRAAEGNPFAQLKGEVRVEELLEASYVASPLRRHDCPPISDGACAMILAVEDVATRVTERPVWIRGIDLNFCSETSDMNIYKSTITEIVIPPNSLKQVLTT